MSKWNGHKFSVYESEEKTVLGLLGELGSQVNHNTDNLKNKTDLYGDHKGSWQGLSRPTLSEEGMRATVEDIIDNKIPSIQSSLDNIVHYFIKNNETLDNINIVDNANFRVVNGEYSSNKEHVIKIQNKKNVVIDGSGTINCSANGVLIEDCENITIKGIKFKRINQAKFGELFHGITIVNSKNITIEGNTCSGFVDGIRATNSTSVKIINNLTEYCGEEGIVIGEDTSGLVENNIVTKHLGDGILLKSANAVTVRNNKIYEPIDKDLTPDIYGSVITDLNPDIPRPSRGGGIGTNVEHSTKQCRNITIENNIIKNTGYGIGTIGVYNCLINNNKIDHVYDVAISITNNTTYNQNNLSSENIIINNNEIVGLLNKNSTNVVKIQKSTGNNIYNLIFANNIVNCVNDYVAHTGVYTNINCKIENNIIDNFNVAIFSEASNSEIINNKIVGVSPNATTKRGIYTKGGIVTGNNLTTNNTIMSCQIFIDGATNLICSDNKIKYNGNEGAIQLINDSKWCVLNNNSFELTSNGANYGGGSVYNGTNKIDGYYRANTIPTEQGYNKDDIVLKSNGDIGDVVGWINQGNKTTSNFKEYGQRGFKSVDGQPSYAPRFIGEEVYDWRNKVFYKGVGTTITDWKVMC